MPTQRGQSRTPPSLEELQDLLLESPDFDAFLLELTVFSASRLGSPEPMLCAISVERDGKPVTVARSSEIAQRMDEKQYRVDDGPCLTALREGHKVLVEDLKESQRWPQYAALVADEDVVSVLAVPIQAGEGASAALYCYATSADTLDTPTISAVEEYAASISRILRLALRVHHSAVSAEPLRSALTSRATIDAALGLIMAQTRGSREQAIGLLHDVAQNRNLRMREIALGIIQGSEKVGSLPGHDLSG